jgi:(p)ppGpp synthase/HD superfamily hydrolase
VQDEPNLIVETAILCSLVDNESKAFLGKALKYAWSVHETTKQTRLSGAPYVYHPIRVARLLVEWGILDVEILAAGLLQDTVDDTSTGLTVDEISGCLSNWVGDLVHHLTNYKPGTSTVTWKDAPFFFDPKRLETSKERDRLYCEWLAHGPDDCLIVRCADKVDNLRDMAVSGWTPRKKLSYADGGRVVLRLASERLGTSHAAVRGLDMQIREVEKSVVGGGTPRNLKL